MDTSATSADHIIALIEDALGITQAEWEQWKLENPEGDYLDFLLEMGELEEAKQEDVRRKIYE